MSTLRTDTLKDVAQTVSIPVTDLPQATALRADLANTTDIAKGSALVGFKQAGTGASARTVLTKLRDYISVLDFGAIGDGVADDSNAIEAAINSGKQLIDFGSRNYKITRPIALYTSGVELVGHGATITQTTVNTNGLIIGQTLLGAYTQVEDVSISGIKFFGSDDGQGTSYGAAITVRPPATNPYVFDGGCNRIHIKDCLFDGWTMGTIATAVTEIRWHNNTSRNMFYHLPLDAGGYGFLVQTCFEVYVTNNRFSSVTKSSPLTTTDRHAIYISGDPSRPFGANNVCRGVYITGNTIDWGNVHPVSGFEACMALRGAFDIRVVGNRFFGGYGGVVYNSENGPGEGVTISSNTFRNIFTNGTNEQGCIGMIQGSGSFIVKRVSITDNTCEVNGANGIGIQIAGVDGLAIGNNVISSPVQIAHGINIAGNCSNVLLSPNVIRPYQANALIFSGANNTKVTIHKQQINFESGLGIRHRFLTVPTTLKYAYERTFAVVSNGAGSVTITNGEDYSFASSVVSDANGFTVTFDGSVDVTTLGINITSHSASTGAVYKRTTGVNTITFGVNTPGGSPMPAASNAYTISVSIPH